LVVAQSSSEIPEGLMNNPVYIYIYIYIYNFRFTNIFPAQFIGAIIICLHIILNTSSAHSNNSRIQREKL